MLKISLDSTSREELVDITRQVQDAISRQDWKDGALVVYCPHTTGAVTVNEGADPDVARDIVAGLAKLVPHNWGFRHVEGNSDAHLKSSLVGCEQLLLVADGRLALGTWQKVFFCEFDGPRRRTLWLSWLPGE